MNLTKYRLGDIATVNISGVDKKSKTGEIPVRLCNFVDVYYNWAVTKDIYDSLMEATCRQEEIDAFTLHKGYVAITKDSETRDDIGVACYIADDFDKTVVLGYHTALIIPDQEKLDAKYLNALLHTAYFQKYWFNNASGSGQRYTLSETAIKDAPVYLPDINEQRKIGEFFSDLDRKVALNRKENATLEAMAKQLYDYWFVQFDFPDVNGRPYKSSGGKMVWNETLKREIPENWGTCQLGDIVEECAIGTSSDELSEDLHYTPIDTMPAKTMSFSSFAPLSEAQSSLCLYKKWNILLGSMRVYFHKVCIAPYDGVTRTTAIVLRPKTEDCLPYCYQVINEDEFIKYATIMSNGSQQPCLAWSSVVNRPIIKPDINIVKSYCEQCRELVIRVVNSQKEQAELEDLRNFILPLLMSGQALL